MTQPWTFAGAPRAEGASENLVTLVEGSTFCISEATGDMRPDRAQGLFVRDTRILSGWLLTVDQAPTEVLTVHREAPYTATYLGRTPPPTGSESTLVITRRRYIGDGMREDITIANVAHTEVTCLVTIAVDADFADLFEVKDGRVQPTGDVTRKIDGHSLILERRRARHEQAVIIGADHDPSTDIAGLRWWLTLAGREQWTTTVEVTPVNDGKPMRPRHSRGESVEHAAPARQQREWRSRSPKVHTADANLAAVLRRSLDDLGALRIFDPRHPDRAVVAAGVPWFMALFGRDSLLTSWMALPLDSTLAIGTLQTLAEHQGAKYDAVSEEEPGRILHEIRFGPATELALGGRGVYYGTADATALFVMLLGEARRWGGDTAAIDALLPHADRALEWIARHGDGDGDGFVEYQRKTETGLLNQGWKDSWDGVNFADGRIAEAPIALAEVQAYTYAAYRARAHFADHDGDHAAKRHWADKAAELKHRFNEVFWLPDREWFAIGLDRDKQPIDALTSNIGHCLWTGIIDNDKAAAVAEHLLSPQMFTGWGIRTLSASMACYNPISYHNGSVWPHDNALCASGLMRYGFVEHAQRVIVGLLDAAEHFDHRLPELFCGFSRDEFPVPVPYPTSCSPQAWAAATPISFLRSLLRFDPELPVGQLWCAPELPERYLPLRVRGLRVSGLDIDIDVHGDDWQLSGLAGTGIELVAPARRQARV